jgi:hypothetical protein
MHTAKFLKEKKIISNFHTTKIQKIYINMYFGFNNQFIKITRTKPIFQKNSKNSFCFILILRITRLYVRYSFDIKKIVFFKKKY